MKHLPPALAIAELLCDLIKDLDVNAGGDGVPSERTLEKCELVRARYQTVLATGYDEGEQLPLSTGTHGRS